MTDFDFIITRKFEATYRYSIRAKNELMATREGFAMHERDIASLPVTLEDLDEMTSEYHCVPARLDASRTSQ